MVHKHSPCGGWMKGLCGGGRLGFGCVLLQESPDPAWERPWRSWWRRRRKHVSKKGQQLGAQHPSEGSGSRKDPYKSWGRDICEQWYHLMTLQLTSEEHWRRWSVSVRSSISQPRWTPFSRQNCIAHVQENCVNCPSLGCCLLYSVYCAVPNPWMMLLRKAPEIRSIWGMLCCSLQSHLNQLSLQSKFPLEVQQVVEMTQDSVDCWHFCLDGCLHNLLNRSIYESGFIIQTDQRKHVLF